MFSSRRGIQQSENRKENARHSADLKRKAPQAVATKKKK
jgi:hypothetical protein